MDEHRQQSTQKQQFQPACHISSRLRSAIDPPNDDFMAWEDNEVVWLLTDDKSQTSATVIHDAVCLCCIE